MPDLESDNAALANATPPDIVRWAMERFGHWRVTITTSFGMEGCALVDMVARTGRATRITYLDTHFLFPETIALRDRMIRRYPRLRFVNEGTPLTPQAQEATHGPRLWERDPDSCCRIRKVEPMQRVLDESDVWITGIRRDQSDARSHVRAVEWDWRFDVLKISPMARWTRADVWSYIRAHDVPYNELHERGYPSIGCTHCTAAVPGSTPADYSRTGRWPGRGKTECGLHDAPEATVA
jgi:phosphoadenosine phosphosulfate reductase